MIQRLIGTTSRLCMHESDQNSNVAPSYIRENFEPGDRLAAVLVNRRTDAVIQRLASAEHMAQADFQSWLRNHNNEGYEIYLSMNALHAQATGRRKVDVAAI